MKITLTTNVEYELYAWVLFIYFIIFLTQNKIFWRRFVTKQLLVAFDFHGMEKHTMEVKGYLQMFDYQHS